MSPDNSGKSNAVFEQACLALRLAPSGKGPENSAPQSFLFGPEKGGCVIFNANSVGRLGPFRRSSDPCGSGQTDKR